MGTFIFCGSGSVFEFSFSMRNKVYSISYCQSSTGPIYGLFLKNAAYDELQINIFDYGYPPFDTFFLRQFLNVLGPSAHNIKLLVKDSYKQ